MTRTREHVGIRMFRISYGRGRKERLCIPYIHGEQELSIEDVRALADQGDPDGLYALGMDYLFG